VTETDWLSARIHSSERGVAAGFDLAAGQVLAVLGPNGAGKSTVLEAIAGLAELDGGTVRIGQRTVHDHEAGVSLPVAERGVGLLAQDALLFGSLSVRENVEFGPRSQGRGKDESRRAAEKWLDAVGAGELARKRPRKLSGGQARRVAIARALAAEPDVLLLDEPFAALDVAVAATIRSMLRTLLAERAAERGGRAATVLVTHDVVDVLTLADQVLVLDNGMVVDAGPVDRALRAPRSPFTADLAGTNMLTGTADRAAEAGTATPVGLRTAAGAQVTGTGLHTLTPGDAVTAVFAPGAVTVRRPDDAGTGADSTGAPADGGLAVTVVAVEARGETVRIRAEHGEGTESGPLLADVPLAEAGALSARLGDRLVFHPDPEAVTVYPR